MVIVVVDGVGLNLKFFNFLVQPNEFRRHPIITGCVVPSSIDMEFHLAPFSESRAVEAIIRAYGRSEGNWLVLF